MTDADRRIDALLVGAVDLHCHSGPSVMPRRLNHVEAIKEAEEAGLDALLFKDHYYSVTPIVAMLKETLKPRIEILSGVPLNNTSGGFNPYAVEHGFKLGARIVWMPTNCSANHIRNSHRHQTLGTKDEMLAPRALTVVDDRGQIVDEVKIILDQIAEYDAVLSAGHLHISEIWPLFDEAKSRGIKRLLVNHPTFMIGCNPNDMRELAGMGAYLEHSCCMWAMAGARYTDESLDQVIKAGGVEMTMLGSDLGQIGNPTPVQGFRHVIGMCIRLGYTDEDIRKMVSRNGRRLFGLDEAEQVRSAAE